MLRLKQFTVVPIAIAVVTALFSAAAVAELPQTEYACQVNTRGGKSLALVISTSKDKAVIAAKGRRALAIDGIWREATRVVQCINPRSEEFDDPSFQRDYKKMPL